MVKQMHNPVMAIGDLAVLLRFSTSTQYNLYSGRKVPGQKIGRNGRFQRAVIGQWLGCEANHPAHRSSR